MKVGIERKARGVRKKGCTAQRSKEHSSTFRNRKEVSVPGAQSQEGLRLVKQTDPNYRALGALSKRYSNISS